MKMTDDGLKQGNEIRHKSAKNDLCASVILFSRAALTRHRALFLLMPVLSQPLFAFVGCYLMSFSFFTARHDEYFMLFNNIYLFSFTFFIYCSISFFSSGLSTILAHFWSVWMVFSLSPLPRYASANRKSAS